MGSCTMVAQMAAKMAAKMVALMAASQEIWMVALTTVEKADRTVAMINHEMDIAQLEFVEAVSMAII